MWARVWRAEEALRALDLSVTTKADKERILRAHDGLAALDDVQANLRKQIFDVLEEAEADMLDGERVHTARVRELLKRLRRLINPRLP